MRDKKGRFIKGHLILKGCENGWFKKGQHSSPKTEFQKGSIAWNKGKRKATPTEKICIKCEALYPISNYYRLIERPQYGSVCKGCSAKASRLYARINRKKVNIITKKWRYKNPLKVKAYLYRRNILTQDLTLEKIQLIYEDNIKKYGTLTCYLCLKTISFRKDCLEHKIPLSRGGTNEYNNLAIAHRSCNNKKNCKTEKEYLAKEAS